MSRDFGLEVTALIAQHYPVALRGEPQQLAEASAQLADCLGGLLAFAHKLHGKDAARQVCSSMFDRIARTAGAIGEKSEEILATGKTPPFGH